ncbi:MAG: trypsin-like peptidase domain-containing protein, partial [bacterium]|nr:trypsin-like peptidase domain-containing protein [bacterium]
MAVAILAAVAVLASGVGLGWGLSQVLPSVLQGRLTPNHPSAGGATNGRIDAQAVANRVNPAIVDVNTEIGAGTGMLVTPSGEVLTNNHVIEGASRIQVSVEGHGSRLPATVLGEDPTHDVALVKLQGVSGLPTVSLAGPNAAKVGQQVVALGNAGGQGGTPEVTQGAITDLNKSITASDPTGASEQLTGLLQTNAPIVEGDSGGALADGSGKVLGMITAGGSDRSPSCAGDGLIKIEMHFLPDVYVPCDVCKGKRYNRETLEVRFGGKNIFEVLDMTAEEALTFFENIPRLKQKLAT